MRVLALGDAATHIPWLSPCAASLAALARAPASAWSSIRFDPGAILLIARQSSSLHSLPLFSPNLLSEPRLLERSLVMLDRATALDWNHPRVQPVWRSSVAYARMASHLAEAFGRCDPEAAWMAGLLAPLGWLAASAVDPVQVGRCLDDPAHIEQPTMIERIHWGLDQASIARRLARRWGLPGWLAAVVGHLSLPIHLAQSLGADPVLFPIVQLAVGLVQKQGVRLGLAVGATPNEILSGLGLTNPDQAQLEEEAGEVTREPIPDQDWRSPRDEPLIPDLLALALDNRRLHDDGSPRNLERDLDELHRLLAEQRSGEAERLREQKLSAMAEFAAGAGHEINNPLAVISGQAQYLLNHEADEVLQKSLETIVQQAQRIHQTLRDLMQFARPARPRPQIFDLTDLLREVGTTIAALAQSRRIALTSQEPAERVAVLGDRGQVAAVLLGLLRNAIEAVPPEGWVRLRVEAVVDQRVDVIVEDSGDGLRHLSPAHREHIFDPFFSGRQAGRGRGLGLPTAWRLARENGGDVHWDAEVIGLTRFIVRLPRGTAELSRSEPIPA